MYVIRTSTTVYPADRCTWADSDTAATDGVNIKTTISNVMFYPGNAAGAAVSGNNPRLGYLGKYGRFIPITD